VSSLQGEEGRKKGRVGKKGRIAMRKKRVIELRAAETEKEKRARRNREKKIKRREKNRKMKEVVVREDREAVGVSD
jgi:predicted GIY-YIG superfamily endonuclease